MIRRVAVKHSGKVYIFNTHEQAVNAAIGIPDVVIQPVWEIDSAADLPLTRIVCTYGNKWYISEAN